MTLEHPRCGFAASGLIPRERMLMVLTVFISYITFLREKLFFFSIPRASLGDKFPCRAAFTIEKRTVAL